MCVGGTVCNSNHSKWWRDKWGARGGQDGKWRNHFRSRRKMGGNGGKREKNGTKHPFFAVPFSPIVPEIEDHPHRPPCKTQVTALTDGKPQSDPQRHGDQCGLPAAPQHPWPRERTPKGGHPRIPHPKWHSCQPTPRHPVPRPTPPSCAVHCTTCSALPSST